jgi:hypothetical protein
MRETMTSAVAVPSESARIMAFAGENNPVQIAVCDLTAPASFRWHFRAAMGGKRAVEVLYSLLLDRVDRYAPHQVCRWVSASTGSNMMVPKLNELTDFICHHQIPIYWQVYSLEVQIGE